MGSYIAKWACTHCTLGACPISGSDIPQPQGAPTGRTTRKQITKHSFWRAPLFLHCQSFMEERKMLFPLVCQLLKVSDMSSHPCTPLKQNISPYKYLSREAGSLPNPEVLDLFHSFPCHYFPPQLLVRAKLFPASSTAQSHIWKS